MQNDLLIAIASSSLLNAIYSRILITSPLQLDEEVFQKESQIVLKQLEHLIQTIGPAYQNLPEQTQQNDYKKNVSCYLADEVLRIENRLKELDKEPLSPASAKEKEYLSLRMTVLYEIAKKIS